MPPLLSRPWLQIAGVALTGRPCNCVIIGNSARYGGGAFRATLLGCVVCNNTAVTGAGARFCILSNCVVFSNAASANGGGGEMCTAYNSIVASNVAATGSGGGVWWTPLFNCLVSGNQAGQNGGGVYGSGGSIINCTVVGNSALNGGGVYNAALANSIVYYNSATTSNDYSSCTLNYSCAVPKPAGAGNFTNAPMFLDLAGNDLHLLPSSPCINTGYNPSAPGTLDLDGHPRIDSGTVDVGAYEFQGYSTFLAWLQSYGLPTNGSANGADTDNDGLNNWQEWVAGTVPTNATSVLVMASPGVDIEGVTLTWQSVSGRTYYVERALALGGQGAFAALETNILGLPGATSYTDTNAPMAGPAYYRVGVNP